MLIPLQLIEEFGQDSLMPLSGGGIAVLEFEESSQQQLFILAIAGGITPTGAVASVANANAITPAGVVTPTGELTFIAYGTDSMEGSITPAGSVSFATVLANIFLGIDDQGNLNGITPTGDVSFQPGLILVGSITPTGIANMPSSFQDVAGGITPEGAVSTVFFLVAPLMLQSSSGGQ